MVNQSQDKHAGDDIPFGSPGESKEKVTDAEIEETAKVLKTQPQPMLPRTAPTLVQGITQKEIFLAIVQGMAASGDFTVGSKLNTDSAIRNAAKHAAGVASFFFQAAKDARI